jgi:hypothetical protein
MSGNIKALDGETLDVVLRCAIQTTRLKHAARVERKAIIGRFDRSDFNDQLPKTTASTIIIGHRIVLCSEFSFIPTPETPFSKIM